MPLASPTQGVLQSPGFPWGLNDFLHFDVEKHLATSSRCCLSPGQKRTHTDRASRGETTCATARVGTPGGKDRGHGDGLGGSRFGSMLICTGQFIFFSQDVAHLVLKQRRRSCFPFLFYIFFPKHKPIYIYIFTVQFIFP